ncbi:hypothetical protein IAD21_00678 [Abditibacteriota bacterium]|nr:hypothetical protein IAD21_00678 [Abditibacteriota bacterium]
MPREYLTLEEIETQLETIAKTDPSQMPGIEALKGDIKWLRNGAPLLPADSDPIDAGQEES